jgi:LysM repeat protein
MRQFKRLFYLVLLNIAVSAITTLVVLNLWARSNPFAIESTPTPVNLATPTALALVVTPTPPQTGETSLITPPGIAANQGRPTPTLVLTPYTVRAGDTLGSIAITFDVSVADILAVNNLADPDTLSIGEVIYIPPGPLPRVTDTPVPSLTITLSPTTTSTRRPTTGSSPTFTATSPSDEPAVVIASVSGPGNLATEKVVLVRTGEGSLSLAGWHLEDEDGNVYTFPQLTLYKGGAVTLHTRAGQDTVVDLYWGLATPVWEPGETITLRDTQGNVRATYTIP